VGHQLIYLVIKLAYIEFTTQYYHAASTQAVIVLLVDVIPVFLLELDAFTLAVDNIATFTFKILLAMGTNLDFMFGHLSLSQKHRGRGKPDISVSCSAFLRAALVNIYS